MPQLVTRTLVQNQQISAPTISPAVTLSGNLVNATVAVDVTVPGGTNLYYNAEVSSDGIVWDGLASIQINNPATPKTTHFVEHFTLPGVIGWQVRINVYVVTGPVTVNSLTVSN